MDRVRPCTASLIDEAHGRAVRAKVHHPCARSRPTPSSAPLDTMLDGVFPALLHPISYTAVHSIAGAAERALTAPERPARCRAAQPPDVAPRACGAPTALMGHGGLQLCILYSVGVCEGGYFRS